MWTTGAFWDGCPRIAYHITSSMPHGSYKHQGALAYEIHAKGKLTWHVRAGEVEILSLQRSPPWYGIDVWTGPVHLMLHMRMLRLS
jgi:hypothetical protein